MIALAYQALGILSFILAAVVGIHDDTFYSRTIIGVLWIIAACVHRIADKP